MGTYGTSCRQRAMVALGGLGANLPADAIYPTAFVDGDGKPLDGASNYVLHFDKGKTPPAEAFCSITMYDNEGFQVPNPINRFAIGDRDKLKFNEDGSLDIYIQSESPRADKEANWLPSPKSEAMGPTMRLYSPQSRSTGPLIGASADQAGAVTSTCTRKPEGDEPLLSGAHVRGDDSRPGPPPGHFRLWDPRPPGVTRRDEPCATPAPAVEPAHG
jgi:hypothetical protein